jgi:RNA polymerase sigma factor (sigma-70 family)
MAGKMTRNEKKELFEKELLPHINALSTFAYHLTYNEQDGQDLVQETYLKAFKSLDHYEPGTNSKAWLFKILKNAYINEYRKNARRPSQVDFEEGMVFSQEKTGISARTSDLRKDIFDNLLGDEVTWAINSLPVDFRTVILLCDVEGFSYEEIAAIVEIPLGTVRSRLHRARKVLKEKLYEYAKNLGYGNELNK